MSSKSKLPVLLVAAMLLGLSSHALGAESGTVLPDTPAGKRIASFIAAFNAGPDQMRAWSSANLSPSTLASRPMDERMAMYQRMRSDMKTIALASVRAASNDEIDIIVKTQSNEFFEFDFHFDGTPDAFVTRTRVLTVESPNAGPAPQTSAKTLSDDALIAALEPYLVQLVKNDSFSGVVLIAHGDRTIFEKTYGLASKEYAVPVAVDTMFNVGSISKLITRIAIEQLVEQRRLSYGDTIARWLPDYPNTTAAKQITVQELLDMTSGIGDAFGPQFAQAPKDRFRTLADYLPLFASKPLEFAPGTDHRYSNGGYIVLGLIVERVSGESYYEYAQKHVFEPAGMKHSGWFERDQVTRDVASGYTKRGSDAGGWRNNIYQGPARGSSAGGGYSSAEDLLKLARALEQQRLLDARDTQALLGDGLADAGGSPGCNAALEIEPTRGYVVVVLSNYDPPAAEGVARKIREWLGPE